MDGFMIANVLTGPLAESVVGLLALFGHGYVWVGLVNRSHAMGWPRKVVSPLTRLGFLAFLVLPAAGLFTRTLGGMAAPGAATHERLLAFYFLACAVWGAFTLLRRLLLPPPEDRPNVLLGFTQEPAGPDLPWGEVAFHGALPRLLTALPLNEVRQPAIDHRTLAVPNLPEPLEGFVVAHLSDLHMTGHTDRAYYELATRVVVEQRFEALVVTGDVIENESCRPWLSETLAPLRAPQGVYYILGNHDLYIDHRRTRDTLDGMGWTPLVDRWLSARWNGVGVALVGNERPWYSGGNPGEPPPREECPLRVVLSHSPDQIGWSRGVGADLVLAGHTHGGQIRPPVLGPLVCPSVFSGRYASGTFRVGGTVMHVSRGLSGETPVRWRCPPEISLLTLTRAAG